MRRTVFVALSVALVVALLGSSPALAATPAPTATPTPTPTPVINVPYQPLEKEFPSEVIAPATWVVENLEGSVIYMIYRAAKSAYVNLLYQPDPRTKKWDNPVPRQAWKPEGAFGQAPIQAFFSSFFAAGADEVERSSIGPIDLVIYTPTFLTYRSAFVNRLLTGLSGFTFILWTIFLLLFMGRSFALFWVSTRTAVKRFFREGIMFVLALGLILCALPLVGAIVEIGNDITAMIVGPEAYYTTEVIPSSTAYKLFYQFDYRSVETATTGYHRYPEYVAALALYVTSIHVVIIVAFARILIINLLTVFAPLALMLLAFPDGRRFGKMWLMALIGFVFIQTLLVGFLQLAGSSITAPASTPVLRLLLSSFALLGSVALLPVLFNTIVHESETVLENADLSRLRQYLGGRR